MQLPTVLTLRHFSDFTEYARAFIPTVEPINYRAWTTTLRFARRGFTRAESARCGRTMTTREINLQFTGGGHARECILHRVTCRRGRALTRRRAFLGAGMLTLRRGEKHTEEARVVSQVTRRRRKKKNFQGALRASWMWERTWSDVGAGVKLSILPVQRRSPANDIDFIQLCGKYICRIAKGGGRELCRELLKRIARRNSRALEL